ncbi:hypothetical protein [Fibrisoma limi]|nr:hypothetical protein [Fibrisoma limi]
MTAQYLLESLLSFQNTYRVVMRHFNDDVRNARLLEPVLGLTNNSIRQRYNKPQLWRISEIRRLAVHYSLSETACVRVQETLPQLQPYLQQLPGRQRRRLERLSQLSNRKLTNRMATDWLIADVNELITGLTNWLADQPA